MIDERKLAEFKKQLEKVEDELRASLEQNTEATAPVAVDAAIGRLSRVDLIQSQQVAVELKSRQQRQLLRIQNALESMSNGKYGRCKKCGGEIGLERLEAQPDSFLCVSCATDLSR